MFFISRIRYINLLTLTGCGGRDNYSTKGIVLSEFINNIKALGTNILSDGFSFRLRIIVKIIVFIKFPKYWVVRVLGFIRKRA